MSGSVKVLGDMVPVARACREDTFIQRYPFPFLLGKEVLEEEFSFRTTVARIEDLKAAAQADALRIRDWIMPLDKPGAPGAATRIFLGRASNNDLVVPHPTVSKLHAYFVKEADKWWLVDVGSSNGSKVNGMKVPARAKAGLNDGDTLVFGKCAFTFISAARLYGVLSRMPPRT